MRFERFSFGSIRINGVTYEHDLVIDGGMIRKRKKNLAEVSRRIWPYSAFTGGEDTLEMPPAGDRHGLIRQPTGDEGG
jgi:hypothetical protein